MMKLSLVLALACAATSLTAQAPYQGNGIGNAFLEHTTARIGGTIDFRFGSPSAPGNIAVLGISDAYGPSTHPIAGLIGLDLAGAFQSEGFVLDAQGEVAPQSPIPNIPSLAQLPPLFAQVAVFEPGGLIGTSKTTRVCWNNPGSFLPAGSMLTARGAHTATALQLSPADQETRVFIAGGGGGSLLVPLASTATELYSPLEQSSVAGPPMATERALHTATLLPDGRVLIAGGTDSAGNVTAQAEIYDPVTNSLTATGAMLNPRVGHSATLLDNGLVLVAGGLSNYTNPLTNLIGVLNTAQDTGELFDPATGQWLAVPGAMASKHSGHAQTLLPDGRVLISGGIQGGQFGPFNIQLPLYTQSCSVYDPATNAFSSTGSLATARAFHGASVLANGDVLISGGSIAIAIFAQVAASDSCERWNGTSWNNTAPLQQPVTNHTQVAAPDGSAIIIGGLTGSLPNLTGSAQTGVHDGSLFVAGVGLGVNVGIPGSTATGLGAQAATILFDGSLLLVGGTDGAAPSTDNFRYEFP
ncbi:MAG: kelch repeat-containing protein [Planctomycetota bacterium]|nr:kelch repeat-containing protein [Planctomycetota bacterium]